MPEVTVNGLSSPVAMEFPGIGICSFETPSEELRPYFIKKYKHFFSVFAKDENGLAQRKFLEAEVADFKSNMFVEQEREEAGKKRMRSWDFWILHGKNSISEREFVNEWIENRVFAPAEDRKRVMEENKMQWKVMFDGLDRNRNNKLEWEEWKACASKRSVAEDILRKSFDVIDSNNDGMVSLDESTFAMIRYLYTDGPDEPFENMYGPIPSQ